MASLKELRDLCHLFKGAKEGERYTKGMNVSPARSDSRPPVRMIAIDIDGTLMPSTGVVMSRRNQEALRRAEAAGIEIVIATGRRHAYAMPLLRQAGLRPETVIISSNGTVTRTFSGDSIDRWLLPSHTARELCGFLRQFGGTTVFTFDRSGDHELVIESLHQLHERIAAWVEANRAFLKEVVPLERAFDGGESPVQGMVCGTVSEMRLAEERLNASKFAGLVELHRTEYAHRNLSILDILPPGVSKGTALERLAARRGIGTEEIVAIGDNYNDETMLEHAGRGVLMGNAPDELLEVAAEKGWHITGTNDEDGVALAIEAILRSATIAAKQKPVTSQEVFQEIPVPVVEWP
jgi:Cof subfamily protein (haloacid dehalogenase superfamily)